MDGFLRAFNMLAQHNSELWQIIGVTLSMSALSTAFSAVIGVPLGIVMGMRNFCGKRLLMRLVNTFMGLPPVVVGLAVFLLLSRSGPFGGLRLLYSVPAMVIAQVLLITPVMVGLTASIVAARAPAVRETALGMGMRRISLLVNMLHECRGQIFSVLFTGFGRAISEVGAVSLVGGNVQYKTRVMTTAIMLETNRGNFEFAIALGAVLLLVSFMINSLALTLAERGQAGSAPRGGG
ncbi:MAG: ABC transporter permease [Clostridia bacterium]